MIGFVRGVSLLAAMAVTASASAASFVEFTVRGVDGRPAANVSVEVAPAGRFPFRTEGSEKTVTTDAAGKARHVLVEAADQLRVTLPGVGFAVTDCFAPAADGTIFVELPRLVPFGAIEGVLPEALRAGVVAINPQAHQSDRRRTVNDVRVDDGGRFALHGLFPGRYTLQPKSVADALPWIAYVSVFPDRTTRDIEFVPDPFRERRLEPSAATVAATTENPMFVRLSGTVRETDGKPVVGATVYAAGYQRSPFRSSCIVLTATTDDMGNWDIRDADPTRQLDDDGRVIAVVPGKPIAWARCGDREWWFDEPRPVDGPRQIDLVLPQTGGALEVRLLRDGRPLRDAAVCIAHEQQAPLMFPTRPDGEAADALGRVLYPAAATDADGWARFDHLQPGTYELMPVEGADHVADALARGGLPQYKARHNQSVPVRRGETTKYEYEIPPTPDRLIVTVRYSDGSPGVDQRGTVSHHRNRLDGSMYSSLGLQLDEQGRGAFNIDGFGLHHVHVSFNDASWGTYPRRRGGPHYDARAVVATSPLLIGFPEPVLTLAYHRPGSLRIELRDADGGPAAGFVASSPSSNEPPFGGGTDADGVLVWKNLTDVPRLSAFVPGVMAPECSSTSPFADDETLIGVKLMHERSVGIENDREKTLLWEPDPVGYVRGRVRPAPGRTFGDYRVTDPDSYIVLPDYRTRYDATTGEFLLGPLSVVRRSLRLVESDGKQTRVVQTIDDVEVRNDRVTFVEFVPEQAGVPTSLPTAPTSAAFSAMRRGRIFRSDGTTPAGGAQVCFVRRGSAFVTTFPAADSDGRFSYRLEGVPPPPFQQRADDPKTPRPFAVALLTENYAPTIVPLPDAAAAAAEWNITLAPAFQARGRVTIGGGPPAGRGNRVQILISPNDENIAAHEFERHFNPSADGTFELGGLAAGTYRGQAALDGIWLSATQEFTVGENVVAESIILDVGRPGLPTVAQCVDAAGRPAAGTVVTLRRPVGPLAARLWPRTLTADAGGTLHIPPLEAGVHSFTTPTGKFPYELQVKPIPATGGAPQQLKIRLD